MDCYPLQGQQFETTSCTHQKDDACYPVKRCSLGHPRVQFSPDLQGHRFLVGLACGEASAHGDLSTRSLPVLQVPRPALSSVLSLCRISYDPTRFPKYLPEAYCLCRGCLTGPFGEEDLRFRSTPVRMPTVVLRRTATCAGGRYLYAEDYVAVAVGCTCVPEQAKDAESINSSLDKHGVKLLLGASDQPAAP
ncbi:interleukin-17D [Echinops telfairi]|uniref:Interleukin-17D n=1 Tax=Echinops telfairi TaxID=9371 RepID=A0AC55DDU5_ECHTE|nr:interleukin-17D [Echinops telfairi]